MTIRRRGLLQGRGAAAVVVGLLLVAGLILVFSGTLTRSTDLESRAAQARAEVAAQQARVDAGRAEVEFLQTDTFIQQQARALGWGARNETLFALPADAPSPRPVPAIGSEGADQQATAPLDAWMELLFGA
jgi:cell division protein FtsB